MIARFLPERRHPVHLPMRSQSGSAGIVFLTVGSWNRKPILAAADASDAIVKAWNQATNWVVGRYVVMPDHVHLFCAPAILDAPLGRWIACWKSEASKHWPRPAEHPVWQNDYWDRELRTIDSYRGKWDYVRANPVRKGLVVEPGDWPFAGELNVLIWNEP